MDTTMKTDKAPVKVILTLVSGEKVWGYMYAYSEERLQDLLNDGRQFLPFFGLLESKSRNAPDIHRMTLLNKNAILKIEEAI